MLILVRSLQWLNADGFFAKVADLENQLQKKKS